MSVRLTIHISMEPPTVVLRPLVPTMLVVSHVHVTQDLLPMLPGWDAGISMNVRRVAVLARQTLTAGTSMEVIIALVKYECLIIEVLNKIMADMKGWIYWRSLCWMRRSG